VSREIPVPLDSRLDRLLVGSPLRKPWVARWVIGALVTALLLSTAFLLLSLGSLRAEALRVFLIGLLFAVLLSIVPVLILRYLDRRERESPWLSQSPSYGER
jgi:hypothetical protein